MKRFLIYYSFIVVSLIVVAGFLTATSYPQLTVAILFFPLFTYFAVRVFPRKAKAIHLPAKALIVPISAQPGEKEDKEVIKLKKEGVDIDRRMFLKLIGSAGISLFLFSLFTRKAEAAFFGSVPGPGTVSVKNIAGNKIDPSEKQPTDGYRISRLDDGSPAYYGFTNKDGAWFIQKELADGSYLYLKGDSGFTSAWADRKDEGVTYGEFENVF